MVLETRNLCKTYRGNTVVDHISLQLHLHEVVGLLGANGAGKTTTFNMIVGLTKPSSGEIWCNKRNITRYPIYKRARLGIGYLPQEPSIFTRMTVEDNLKAILETLNLSQEERQKRLDQLLVGLQIDHLRHRKATPLSGGERRRVEIARTLVTSPSFLLLDEPFSGLDPKSVEDMRLIITQLREVGIGVLVTDHNVVETLKIIDRAYIVNEGKLLFSGSPDDAVANEAVREAYLGQEFGD